MSDVRKELFTAYGLTVEGSVTDDERYIGINREYDQIKDPLKELVHTAEVNAKENKIASQTKLQYVKVNPSTFLGFLVDGNDVIISAYDTKTKTFSDRIHIDKIKDLIDDISLAAIIRIFKI